MVDNLHIGFSGACSVGKTTLINALAGEYPQFNVQRESVRYLKDKYNFSFHDAGTALQMALLHMQTKLLYEQGLHMLDRVSLDSMAFVRYYRDRGESDLNISAYQYILDESKKNMEKIDLIIYLKPEFPIIPDGIRIADDKYQKETDAIFEKLIKEWNLEDKVIRPTGTVVERVNFCKKYIDGLLKN